MSKGEKVRKAWRERADAGDVEGAVNAIVQGTRRHPRGAISDEARAIGNLRHLYRQMIGGQVKDVAEAARGLLGPAIETLEVATARRARRGK